ncbi:MAG: ribosomal protein L37E [Porticoccaceae bacterium]|jgi:hypothetical protein
MDYFRLSFVTAPASEGEDIEYVTRQTCSDCGLRFVPIRDRYLVPEDTVAQLHLEVEDTHLPPAFEAAGLLVTQIRIAEKLARKTITGFEVRPVQITNYESGLPIADYAWLAITGRCATNSVWDRPVSTCATCGMERTEPVRSTQRIITILDPKPTMDLIRSRERSAGIMVSDTLRRLLLTMVPEDENELEFKKLHG